MSSTETKPEKNNNLNKPRFFPLNFWGIEMVQQRTELLTPYGRVEVIALRSGDGPRSTVLVNVGCYYTLADAGTRIYKLFSLD